MTSDYIPVAVSHVLAAAEKNRTSGRFGGQDPLSFSYLALIWNARKQSYTAFRGYPGPLLPLKSFQGT